MPNAPKRSADSGKSATPRKKRPAKRGPTKAAALKALGLSQEDLDALKALRNATTNDAAVDAAEGLAGHRLQRSDPEAGKAVEASAVVHPAPGFGGDGMSASPSDPQNHLENRQAPEQKAWNAPEENAAPIFYARNLRGVDVGFRLTRQQAQGEKRTNLKPRGSRGDMIRLQPEDLRDPELSTQVGYGLVEVIPEGEAQAAIKKQYTNAASHIPEHIRSLRNPLGQEYAQANPVTFATDEEAYGVKVADLNPDLMAGKLSDKEIKRDAGVVQPQNSIIQPVQTPSPGRIVEDGFMAPVQQDPSGDNEKQAQVDAKLRAGQFEARPEDNLGVKVSLEPTERVQ